MGSKKSKTAPVKEASREWLFHAWCGSCGHRLDGKELESCVEGDDAMWLHERIHCRRCDAVVATCQFRGRVMGEPTLVTPPIAPADAVTRCCEQVGLGPVIRHWRRRYSQ